MSTLHSSSQRFILLDIIRGIGVLLMILFHFCYDLSSIGLLSMQDSNIFWFLFPRVIVFIFFSVSGFTRGFKPPNNEWKNIKKLAAVSLVVSLVTYLLFPKQWIYFGTLHSLCFSHLMISKKGLLVPFLALVYFTSESWGPVCISSWNQSLDHIRIYPWFGVFFVFFLLGKLKILPKCVTLQGEPTNFPGIFLLKCGRNALGIYLIHRPIGIGVVKLLEKFLIW